jgi:SnoaL-like domain
VTDLATLSSWLNRYVAAWRSNDAEQIGSLFSDAAVYRWHPYDTGDAVAHGREAIVKAWLDEPDEPGSWEMTVEPLAVTGDLGVARCLTVYPEEDGGKRYHNIFLIRLDDEGRCSDFTEYFMLEPSSTTDSG